MNFSFLSGTRVIESSAFIAAPLAGLTLAQFGADVIRVDLIGGGIDYRRLPNVSNGRSLYWTSLNKDKRSIAIDLKKPEGRELLAALVTAPGDEGGVLLTNVGVPWLSHAKLSLLREDLISCTIEGNADGTTAVDYTINCSTGYPSITGAGSISHPVNHPYPAWDTACAFQAALAVTSAFHRRSATREGAEIRLALSDVAFSMLSHLGLLGEQEVLGQGRESIGNNIYGAFGGDFETSDGERVMVAAISSRQWKALVMACDIEEAVRRIERETGVDLTTEEGRFSAGDAIAIALKPWFAARPLSDINALFTQQNVCWGLYETTKTLLERDPRVSLSNPIFENVDVEGVGRHRVAGTPVRLADASRGDVRPAPLLGRDTDEILASILNLDGPAIGKLHDAGVVAGPDKDPSIKN